MGLTLAANPYSTGRLGVAYGGAVSRAESIKGADDFLKLSKALKAAGQTEFRKELHKGMRNAARPLIPEIRDAARQKLPHRGGLNERIAKKPYQAQVRTGSSTAGVRIVGSKVEPRINAQGRVAHPVFGRTGKPKKPGGRNTVVQQVPAARGYFDRTLQEKGPQIRVAVAGALNDFAQRLARGV